MVKCGAPIETVNPPKALKKSIHEASGDNQGPRKGAVNSRCLVKTIEGGAHSTVDGWCAHCDECMARCGRANEHVGRKRA